MATPNEQLSVALSGLGERADRLCDDVDDLLTKVSVLREVRNGTADAVSKDQQFSSVMESLRALQSAVDACSAASAKASDSLLNVEHDAQRVCEVARG